MAYKKDDNGGQAAASAAPASSSSGSSGRSISGNYSSGGGKGSSSGKSSSAKSFSGGSRDSSAHAAASADRAAAAGRGKVTAFNPSVRGGAGGSGSKSGAAFSPAYVGKNPYQWGNNEGIVNHWNDDDPERQAKLDALGFAADDPDRSFHYYEPDKGSDKSYLERANSLNIDRNFFQAGNFWNTIDGPYDSEDARKSDAAQWMLDAQTYGKWAREHNLTYTDEDGNTRNMEDAWKDIWDYANEITGGLGDSESTRAGKDIEAYLTGGKYDSETTQKLLDQAKYFADNAESEKEASRWADYEKSLKIQLDADQKQEKKDNSFLGKAWDTVTGWFEKPERAEQGELTDTQKAYQQAAAEDQALSGYATDPLAAAQFAPIAERRDELAEQVKAENRAAGREVYAGMEDEDRLADATESWLGGRGAGVMAGVAGGMYAVDSMFYDNDEIRQLTQQQWQADQAFLTTGDPKYQAESEALQAQIDEAQRRAIENGENGTPLADTAGMLLESAKGMQDESDRKWQDVTEDMSDAGKFNANVIKTGADVVADVVENFVAPGVGTMRMYLGSAGSGALEQSGRENNDPDSIAAAAVTRAASAYLSTKLVGGMEGVYGKSVLGGITDDMISGASPATQAAIKTLLNTEGVEEGLEDILNYGADLVMGLSPEEQLQWNEVGQDAFVGYVLGVLTNGLSAGINYDSKARHALAEEALEFAQSGMSIEEAAEIAKETTKDQVVMKPPVNEAQNQDMAASQNSTLQGQDQNVAPAPEQNTAPAIDQQQAQDMATSQNQALEAQNKNVAPAPQRAANGPSATAEPYTGPELPGATYGGGTTVKVGKTKVPVHFAVVPISELNVSHDIYGNRNQNYPGELQPRDRSRGTAQNQAIEIGTNLDPGELEWSNNATTGAPIIRPDGTVISGNGRTNGIGYALETGRGGEYTQYLRDNAERFGIDPNSVGDDSVLVRVADGDYNWQAMAEQANVSDVSRMSTTEQAGVDAERLSRYPEILDKLVPNDTGDLNTADNADFVKEFLQAVVPTSEQGSVWTEKGGLSQEGKRRVENAVFQMAYGDASLMARLSESLDNNMKNVSNSLLALAPKVATLENNVANGTRYIGIRDTLLEGVKIFEEAKNRGVDVGKVVDQISMDSNASPEAVFIAEFLQGNAKSAKQIRTFLNAMADTAEDFGDPTHIGFFDTGDTEYTSKDVLEGAIARYEQETGNQLGRPDYDFYGDVFDTGADRESEGTDSAEADAAVDRSAPGAGENTGSGENGRVSTPQVQKKNILDSAKLKGVTATLKKGDQALIQNAIKSRNPKDYIENYGNSKAQRVRLTKYFNAAYSNPAMLLKNTDAEKANLLETALSPDWIYDSDAILFRLLMEQNPDGSGAEFRFADWARENGLTDPEDIEWLRGKARGLSVNYPELLNYTDTNDLDTMSLRSADEIEEAFTPAAEPEPETEARAPQYGEEGFVNPMGEDIEEDEGSSPFDESVDEDEDLPPLEDLLAEMAEEDGRAPAQQSQDTAGMLLGEEAETNRIPPAPDNPEQGAGKTQTWHDLKNVVTDSPNAAITSSSSEYGTSYTVYAHDENGNTSFRPFDSYAEAKAYYDYLNGNPSSYTEDVFTGWGTQATQETSQNVQGNPEGVNSQAEETNSNTGVLNAQETAGNANPEQNTQNPQTQREKISQYFLNTLTESGRAEGLDPVTYNPTSEAESLTNAAMKLAEDKQAVLDRLMSSPAWNGELTDAAWLIENEFLKEFRATKDRTSWDAWRKLETYKISETAKGLQAVAKQSRPGAAGVLEASLNLLEDFKKKGSKANQAVSQQEVTKAEKDVTDVAYRMAEIENEIDQRTEGGMDETEARAMSKEAYLDLAEKINQIRNTGKMFFGGKKKFRNMLGSQDMDFIQRFVACQAAGIAEDVNYKGKQDRLKQLNTFQKLAQLTGTGTWSRNLQGNATFGLIDLLANNGVAVAVDQIVSKATGQRSTGFELGALSRDARSAAKRALDRSILEVAANIDLAENSAMEGYDLSRTRTFDPNGNIVERVLSRWEQWNGYMLNSSDKFFRGGAARSSADAIRRANARNGYNVNDADVQQTADQVAAYRLFQNNGVAAEAADSIREGLNRLGAKAVGRTYERGQFGLGTALTPYTKVPTNIGVKALEFSPAGAAKGFAEILRTASDAKAGKATMAQQNQAVTDFARGVTGTALIVGLAQLMKGMPFFKDWENEEDKDVKAQNRAEGKSGMQFNLDMMLRAADGDEDPTWRNSDRTIDISSIEPANQLMTAASLISEGMPAGQAILQSAKENFMGLPSVSALKNIEDTIRYTDTPDDLSQTLLNTAASTVGGVASGFIPAPIRHATTVSDEYARDTSGSNATERAVNQFKASVPGLRETLPVKTDNFGNEISAGSLGTRLLNTYGGNKYSEINQSDLSREAERLREATGEQLIPSRNGPSSEKFGDEKVKFTAGERKDWKDEYGQDLGDAVGMLMRSSIYKDADDDLKAELWKNLEGYAKDGVKAGYADDHDLQYDSKYDYLDDVDNPVTFMTANKAFNIAEANDDYDIVDTLIGPVGRMSQDDQDLMRQKNSTLMNYYDYLTPNDRGYKVKDAETVRQFKKDAKANAEGRGKTSASGQDKFSSVYNGYLNRAFTDEDVDAIMSKSKTTEDEETGDTTVTWDITKGRAAIYLAMRAGGATVREALDAVMDADVDYDNTIDEKGIKIKAEYEGTNALKRYGSGNDAMWYEFNEIMYPYKNQR